jgi:hypothetical protein
MIRMVSFIPAHNVPIDDYRDYIGREITVVDIRIDLRNGVMPPGLLMQDDYGRCAQVVGRYGSRQHLEYVQVQDGSTDDKRRNEFSRRSGTRRMNGKDTSS